MMREMLEPNRWWDDVLLIYPFQKGEFRKITDGPKRKTEILPKEIKICTFCTLLKNNPEEVLYEDEKIFIIRDRKPCGSAHYLVVPRAHVSNVASLDGSEEQVELILHMKQQGMAFFQTERGENSPHICFRVSKYSHVDHLHLHLIQPPITRWPSRFVPPSAISPDSLLRLMLGNSEKDLGQAIKTELGKHESSNSVLKRQRR